MWNDYSGQEAKVLPYFCGCVSRSLKNGGEHVVSFQYVDAIFIVLPDAKRAARRSESQSEVLCLP